MLSSSPLLLQNHLSCGHHHHHHHSLQCMFWICADRFAVASRRSVKRDAIGMLRTSAHLCRVLHRSYPPHCHGIMPPHPMLVLSLEMTKIIFFSTIFFTIFFYYFEGVSSTLKKEITMAQHETKSPLQCQSNSRTSRSKLPTKIITMQWCYNLILAWSAILLIWPVYPALKQTITTCRSISGSSNASVDEMSQMSSQQIAQMKRKKAREVLARRQHRWCIWWVWWKTKVLKSNYSYQIESGCFFNVLWYYNL